MGALHGETGEATAEALRLFYRASKLDLDFAPAYGQAAWCYGRRKANGRTADRVKETCETARLARRAVELGKEDAVALATGAVALAFGCGDIDDGAACIDRALALNPNLAAAWSVSGRVRPDLGDPQ